MACLLFQEPGPSLVLGPDDRSRLKYDRPMSKNSKSRRDAKKKKSAAPRLVEARPMPAPVFAQLVVDGAVYATLVKSDNGWALSVDGKPALADAEARTLVGVMQAIDARAEDAGFESAVQASGKLKPLLGAPASEDDEVRYESLASKLLARHPLRASATAPAAPSLMQRLRGLLS